MKEKKKIGLVKRIAAGAFALMLVASCLMGSVPYYASSSKVLDGSNLKNYDYVLQDTFGVRYTDVRDNYFYDIYFNISSMSSVCAVIGSYQTNLTHNNILFENVSSGYLYLYSKEPFYVDNNNGGGNTYQLLTLDNGEQYYAYYTNLGRPVYSWNIYPSSNCLFNGYFSSSTCDVFGAFESGLIYFDPAESYNSSLGYLQNIKRQTLYLENDAFSPVEETLKYQFSFDKITTTGSDLTAGNWSVRHYMQVEVKNAKKDYETVEVYDKILMGEYPAGSCKVGYMFKDTVEKLHAESEFDGLSWWESNGLGYITYYNDYFQLVRTNDDGTVEYGGFVKVWQDEFNINHSTTLGEDESQDDTGYNDNIVSGSHGSGGTYEDAEHDADENAANSSNADSELMDQVNDIVSTVMAVPEIFARMFSFLPDWCLNFLGISVALAGALLLWKVARG